MNRQSTGCVSRPISEAQRGRCARQVGVNVIPRMWLKRDWSDYLYHQKCTFLFKKLTPNNFIVKRAYCEEILWRMTSWKVSQIACERGRSSLERLVVICMASWQSSKLFLVTVCGLARVERYINTIPYHPVSTEAYCPCYKLLSGQILVNTALYR